MNYNEMTVESLANEVFEQSGYKVNKADLESRIQFLIDKAVNKSNREIAIEWWKNLANPFTRLLAQREIATEFGIDTNRMISSITDTEIQEMYKRNK